MTKSRKQKQKLSVPQKTEVVPQSTINEETLTKAIANALVEYDKQKEQAIQDKEKKEQEAFEKRLGKNKFVAGLKLLFRPRKYAKNVQANPELIKTTLKYFYKIIEWTLLLLSFFLIACIPLQFIIPNMPIAEWYIDVIFIVWTMPLFLLSRIFRIASIEVEHIKDYNYLFGLFAAITSIISVVIAIIAIFK